MKKLTKQKKEYLARYSIRKAIHEKKRRLKRKNLRYTKRLAKPLQRKFQKFVNNPEKEPHKKLIAPEEFSLIENPSVVISYIEEARKSLHSRNPIELDLSRIKISGIETLMYLCATIKDPYFSKNTPLSGNIPEIPYLKKMYLKAGFYKFVTPRMHTLKKVVDINSTLIHRFSNTQTDSVLAGKLTQHSLKFTLGVTDPKTIKKDELTTLLIECMSNTTEHANFGTNHPVYDWWVIAYKETDTNITKFCFLDIGVGIFGSLEKKYFSNKLTNNLVNKVIPNDNKKTLEKIFSGEAKRTSTKKTERGLGLNCIYDIVKTHKNINKFMLLSNNIKAEINRDSDRIDIVSTSFQGTLYYWELWPTKL